MYVGGLPTAFVSCEFTSLDSEFLGADRGTHLGQQLWEALAFLVALRLWETSWATHRVQFTFKGDRVGALTLLARVMGQVRGPQRKYVNEGQAVP